MKYKAILFDIDDTLCNTSQTKEMVFSYVYKENLELQKIPEHLFKRTNGMQTFSRVEMWLKIIKRLELNINTKALVNIIQTYWHHSITSLNLFDNVRETLEQLVQLNVITCVFASSDFYSKAKKLIHLGIDNLFHYVFTAELIKISKNNPEINKYVSSFLKINPKEILVVGNDLEYDIAPAKIAGMKTALVNIAKKVKLPSKGAEKPDFVLNNFSDLLKLL